MADKITAIYIRVSTTQQKFDSQMDDLKRYIEHHKPVKVKWFKDKFTGKTMERKGFNALYQDLLKGKLKEIIVWRLDRLGRTASGLTKLFDELPQYNCNLVSLKDSLDLSTPAGRLNANIIASVAHYETEVRGERIRSGMEAARRNGKQVGGSLKGKRKGKVADKVKTVLALLDQGMSKAEISRTLGISTPTIYSIIKERQGK